MRVKEKSMKVGLGKMGNCSKMLFTLFIGSLIGLAGCSEKSTKEETPKSRTVDLETEIANEEISREEIAKKVDPKPIIVNVIDPNTKGIIKTINPVELGFGTDDQKYKEEIEKWTKELARGTEASPGFDKRNIPDRIDANGQIIKGSPRIILEETELTQKMLEASVNGGDIEIPLKIFESGYNPQEVATLGEVVVASYTTHYNSNVAGRTKNIELSALVINNVIVGNGDYFSFNTTVGPSDEAHGYQPAEEAVDGKLVMGIGGGICQTSSTLFNAVDQLGVSYVEKHHHSVNVGYVPKGRDATVSYGGLDFRFQNTTGAPFLIKTIFGNGTLTVEVRTSALYQGMIKKAI
jgi:vancomycin resistance protein YoaR